MADGNLHFILFEDSYSGCEVLITSLEMFNFVFCLGSITLLGACSGILTSLSYLATMSTTRGWQNRRKMSSNEADSVEHVVPSGVRTLLIETAWILDNGDVEGDPEGNRQGGDSPDREIFMW